MQNSSYTNEISSNIFLFMKKSRLTRLSVVIKFILYECLIFQLFHCIQNSKILIQYLFFMLERCNEFFTISAKITLFKTHISIRCNFDIIHDMTLKTLTLFSLNCYFTIEKCMYVILCMFNCTSSKGLSIEINTPQNIID